MNGAGVLKRVITVFLLLVVVSLTVGAVLGQPVGLAYVETGSMEPKLAPGDGFVAVPTFVAGPPEPGDVVTFDAVNINGGGLVTHRIVEEGSAGYITKGDANPVPDQAGAEPPVQESQIKATALQVGGELVVIPQLGAVVLVVGNTVGWVQQQLASLLGTRAVLGTQGIGYLLLGFGFVSYVVAAFLERSNGRDRSRRVGSRREVVTARTVIVTMVLVLMVVLTAAMVLPGGAHEFQFVSSESGGPGASVILQGTAENVSFSLPSNGVVPVVVILETTSPGISTNQSAVYVPGGTEKQATVTIQAPDETGNYVRTMTEHRYFAFLPMSVIVWLFEIHPWLPIVGINALTGALFVLTAMLIIGLDPIRIGRRQTNVSLRVRLRRWFE
jgi:signal peptidase